MIFILSTLKESLVSLFILLIKNRRRKDFLVQMVKGVFVETEIEKSMLTFLTQAGLRFLPKLL